MDRAEAAFRKDMDRSVYGRCHPDNIWALHGLASCLAARVEGCCGYTAAENGGPIIAELREIKEKIAAMSAVCDVDIGAACMCAAGKGDN